MHLYLTDAAAEVAVCYLVSADFVPAADCSHDSSRVAEAAEADVVTAAQLAQSQHHVLLPLQHLVQLQLRLVVAMMVARLVDACSQVVCCHAWVAAVAAVVKAIVVVLPLQHHVQHLLQHHVLQLQPHVLQHLLPVPLQHLHPVHLLLSHALVVRLSQLTHVVAVDVADA